MASRAPLLIVDGANVVGSRPDGWWRDRAGAAAKLCHQLAAATPAELSEFAVVLVLEGAARPGAASGEKAGVNVVHAPGSGDDTIAELIAAARAEDSTRRLLVVTADRGLRGRVEAYAASCLGPGWLRGRLPAP